MILRVRSIWRWKKKLWKNHEKLKLKPDMHVWWMFDWFWIDFQSIWKIWNSFLDANWLGRSSVMRITGRASQTWCSGEKNAPLGRPGDCRNLHRWKTESDATGDVNQFDGVAPRLGSSSSAYASRGSLRSPRSAFCKISLRKSFGMNFGIILSLFWEHGAALERWRGAWCWKIALRTRGTWRRTSILSPKMGLRTSWKFLKPSPKASQIE